MKTIGETLKGRRERLGMTLAELEERTQIKRDTLKLIEQNQFDKLAKVDYAEGFIRRYASVVNIDSQQLIQAHQEEIPDSQHQLNELLYIDIIMMTRLHIVLLRAKTFTINDNYWWHYYNNFYLMGLSCVTIIK